MTSEEKLEETKPENTAEEDSKPKFSLKYRVLMLAATIIVAMIMLLIAIPGFFDNSNLKFKIEQKLSQNLNTNLSINGQVEVSLFPYPSITLHDVFLQNYKLDDKVYGLHSDSVKINLSIMKFFRGEFHVTQLVLTNPILQTYFDENSAEPRVDDFSNIITAFSKLSPENHEEKSNSSLSSELFKVEKFDNSQFSHNNLPTLEIEDGSVISYDKFSRKREIRKINGTAMINSSKIRAEGKFNSENIETNFKTIANFKSEDSANDSIIELHSATMNMTIKGSFTGENNGLFNSNFTGKAEVEIFELRNFYRDYISSNTAIYAKLKPNSQSIKISSDIRNTAGEIALDNILINSNLVNGKGGALIDFTSKMPRIDITLNLDNLDLDNIWSKERIEVKLTNNSIDPENNSDETTESIQKNTDPLSQLPDSDLTNKTLNNADKTESSASTSTILTKSNQDISAPAPEAITIKMASKFRNFELSAEVQAKEVKFLDGQIKNLDLYTTISKDGKIMVLPMIFDIPGEGMVRLNGVLENNENMPRFIGKIDVTGKNLGETFKWLNLQSQNLKFDNLKDYIVYSDVLLFPNNITLDNFYLNLNNEQSEFLGRISIDSSDKVTKITNQFQVSTFNIDDFFLTSGQNIYLSSGSLLRKFLWLNDIASNNDISLNFEKLIYKGEEFSNDASLKIAFGQGYIKINELKLNSAKTSLQANLSIDISDKNPLFIANVVADNLHYDSISLANNINSTDSQNFKKVSVADQFFALPSLEGFGGNINIVTNNLTLDNLAIQKSKLSGNLKDGNITETTLECSLYGGSFKYEGLIGIKNDKIINGNITLTNATLNNLMNDLVGINNINGVANISANITTVAGSKTEFLKNTTSEIKFNAAGITIQKYGLSDLIGKLFYHTNYRNELKNPEEIINNPESTTNFKQASGTINLDKEKSGKMSINLSAQAVNAVLSGKIDLSNNSTDSLFNVIFVTGSRQKAIPLNVATAIKGDISNASTNSNLDQVRQYLGLSPLNKPASASTETSNSTNPNPNTPKNDAGEKSTLLNTTNSTNTQPQPTNSIPAKNNAAENQRIKAAKASEETQTQDALNKLKAVMANPNAAGQILNQQPNNSSQ